jgi:hypothetical protein
MNVKIIGRMLLLGTVVSTAAIAKAQTQPQPPATLTLMRRSPMWRKDPKLPL